MKPDMPHWQFDQEPSSAGVQILIPSMTELHAFVVAETSRSADTTQRQRNRAFRDWLVGDHLQEPHALRWDTPLDHALFAKYEIKISTGYSPKNGAWADLASSLWTNDVGKSWEVPQKAETIVAILKVKGINALLEVDHDEEYQILISSSDETAFLTLSLGQKYREDAVQVYGTEDVSEYGNNPFILRPGKIQGTGALSFALPEFTNQLQHFQAAAPQAIAALYESFEMTAPQVVIELSVPES